MPTGKPDDKELSPISGRLMKTTASRKLDEVVETLTHSMSFIVTKPASNQTVLTFVFEIKSVTSLRPETWQPFGVVGNMVGTFVGRLDGAVEGGIVEIVDGWSVVRDGVDSLDGIMDGNKVGMKVGNEDGGTDVEPILETGVVSRVGVEDTKGAREGEEEGKTETEAGVNRALQTTHDTVED
jgi:hypothetical protein